MRIIAHTAITAVSAGGLAAAAAAAPAWKTGDEAAARAGAKRVLLIALRGAVPLADASGACRLDAIVVGTERGSGPVPGAPTGLLVPCAGAAPVQGAKGRGVPTTALRPGSLWRLYLSGGGRPRDLEAIDGSVAAIEPSVQEADRRQVWRLLRAGSGDTLLVDTEDVAAEGDRRIAWVKRNLKRPQRMIVQVITRVEFDCTARTQTLHAWYARTASERVDSQGIVPEGARRSVPILRDTDAVVAMAALCRRVAGG